MYQDFFRFTELPFAIVPNPKFFFLSERHKEALSHMLSGISGGGGIALLTGEVGTGKTMTMRALLARFPSQSQVLTILNPSINELELLQTICDGLGLAYDVQDNFKHLLGIITQRLYDNEANGIDTVLLVDEAQHLKPEVLEQLRLLTNIETSDYKLLKVILIGQPELQQLLRRSSLRQLAQRITERYHLMPLPEDEMKQYILHRLICAGKLDPLFDEGCYRIIAKKTGGVPRLVNLVCDQALKTAYREGKRHITVEIVRQACRHVLEWQSTPSKRDTSKPQYWRYYAVLGAVGVVAIFIRYDFLKAQYDSWTADSTPTVAEIQDATPINTLQGDVLPTEEVLSDDNFNEDLSDVETIDFSTVVKRSHDMDAALENLYRLWGYEADHHAVNCETAVRADLSCYQGKMPLSQLFAINRPAVLVMDGPGVKPWYATLYGVGQGQVELMVGHYQQRLLVSDAFLKQHWTGNVMLLWRPPLGNTAMLKDGQRNGRVRWLDERLNISLGKENNPSNFYSPELKQKVREFQRLHGIGADGIAGPLTIMTLDGVLGIDGAALTPIDAVTTAQMLVMDEGEIIALPEMEQSIALRQLPEKVIAAEQVTSVAPLVEKPLPVPVTAPPAPEEVIAKVAEEPAPVREIKSANPEKSTTYNNKPMQEMSLGDEFVDIGSLDLSSLSPSLAKHVTVALSDVAKIPSFKEKKVLPTTQQYSNVVGLADLPADLLSRLPPMDFQAHVYASNVKDRWVRVNEKNVVEGEAVAANVLLRGIEPQQVVVQFEGKLIAIPALSTW